MRKKPILIIVISLISITLISGILFVSISKADDKPAFGQDNDSPITPNVSPSNQSENNSDYTYIPPTLVDITIAPEEEEPIVTEAPFVPATEMDLELGSMTIFVNKEFALPKNYYPDDLVQVNVHFNLDKYDERTMLRREPAKALEKMFEAAKEDGYILSGVSGFRSYERQKKIFTNNIVVRGKEHTLRYSAVPGTSEHQTGLAIDVSSERSNYKLITTFGSTPEGIWLARNAHHFGYIIRYPKDKYEITGYAYEPWHIRYVGKPLATYLYNNNLTLDEYYNYTPSTGFDFEAQYADLINYIPPNVTIVPEEGEGVIIGENGEIIDVEDFEEPPVSEDTEEDTKEDTKQDAEEDTEQDTPSPTPTKPPKDEEPDNSDSDKEEDTQEDNNEDPSEDNSKEDPPTEIPVPTIPLSPTPGLTPSPSPSPTPAPGLTPYPSPSQPAPTPFAKDNKEQVLEEATVPEEGIL